MCPTCGKVMSQGHLRWRHKCDDRRKCKGLPSHSESVHKREETAAPRERNVASDDVDTESDLESTSSEEPTRESTIGRGSLNRDEVAARRYGATAQAPKPGIIAELYKAIYQLDAERRRQSIR